MTDCVVGAGGADLRVPGWLAAGAPSLQGVQHIGSIHHQGRDATGATAPTNADEDIDFDHEAELTQSGNFLIATDERGGGILPPGASCAGAPGGQSQNPLGNGGVHFYKADALHKGGPGTLEEEQTAYAQTPEGERAIFRAAIQTQPRATICTAHVFHQIPGENRIFMAWYSQGTRVLDFLERPDGTIEFKEAGYFIPENANQWVSAVFKRDANADGTVTYHGASADFNLGEAGRNAIDVYKVTLPPAPVPAAGPGVGNGAGGSGGGGGGGAGGGRREARRRPLPERDRRLEEARAADRDELRRHDARARRPRPAEGRARRRLPDRRQGQGLGRGPGRRRPAEAGQVRRPSDGRCRQRHRQGTRRRSGQGQLRAGRGHRGRRQARPRARLREGPRRRSTSRPRRGAGCRRGCAPPRSKQHRRRSSRGSAAAGG